MELQALLRNSGLRVTQPRLAAIWPARKTTAAAPPATARSAFLPALLTMMKASGNI